MIAEAEHTTLVICYDSPGTINCAKVPTRLLNRFNLQKLNGQILGLKYSEDLSETNIYAIKYIFYLLGFCEPHEFVDYDKVQYAYWKQYVSDLEASIIDDVLLIGWVHEPKNEVIDPDEFVMDYIEAIETNNAELLSRLARIASKDPELLSRVWEYIKDQAKKELNE
jgi:hypothetical protein